MTTGKVFSFFDKPIFYYIGGILNAFLFVFLFFRFFQWQDTTIIKTFTPSPDGNHIAITYINMGGGAAGYCYTYLALVPKWHPPGFDKAEFNVTIDRCSSKLTPRWENNTTLIVEGQGEHISSSEQKISSDGKVKIIYK